VYGPFPVDAAGAREFLTFGELPTGVIIGMRRETVAHPHAAATPKVQATGPSLRFLGRRAALQTCLVSRETPDAPVFERPGDATPRKRERWR